MQKMFKFWYSNEKVLEKHKINCNEQEITSIKTSNERHIILEKIIFIMIPLYFRIYSDFECDNQIDNSYLWEIKQLNIYKQNAVCSGYYIVIWIKWCLEVWLLSFSIRLWTM